MTRRLTPAYSWELPIIVRDYLEKLIPKRLKEFMILSVGYRVNSKRGIFNRRDTIVYMLLQDIASYNFMELEFN